MNLPISSCQFITANDLGNVSPNCRQAMDIFFEYENHSFSFGYANRTMIDIWTFLQDLDSAFEVAEMHDDEGKHPAYEEVFNLLNPLTDKVYIDVAN